MTTNPVQQISKIQIRRGLESDLPPNLSIGELGYSIDTSRIFIGSSPSYGQINYLRPSFPYQNVEILTETSPVVPTLVQKNIVNIGNDAFHTALLTASTPSWTDVHQDTISGTIVFEMSGSTIAAKIEYFAYDSDDVPVKQGTLNIIHSGGSSAIIFVDDSISARRTDIVGASSYDPATATDEIIFRVYHNGDGAYRIQYQNLISKSVKVFFRIVRPIP